MKKTPRLLMKPFSLSVVGLTLALALPTGLAVAQSGPQPTDDTQLKQVIIFGRHGVRTPNLPYNSAGSGLYLDALSALPFPPFSVSGVVTLTPNGARNETLLGGYFRLWLTKEGLLTGKDSADASFVSLRAIDTPLIVGTAQAFAAGFLPAATININSIAPPAIDALFDPVDAGVAHLDYKMAVAAVNGRLGDTPQSMAFAYAPELALSLVQLSRWPDSDSADPRGKARRHLHSHRSDDR
jgi:glucose-1-phosphatase